MAVKHCLVAGEPITPENDSLVHITPNSIGGRLKYRGLVSLERANCATGRFDPRSRAGSDERQGPSLARAGSPDRPLAAAGALRQPVAAAGREPDCQAHTLRHTAATWLMPAGVDKSAVAGYLGMSVEMLDRVYGHHHPDHLRAAAQAISQPNRWLYRWRRSGGSAHPLRNLLKALVADAVESEPVSAGKIPLKREFSGIFRVFGTLRAALRAVLHVIS